ncbi:YecA family protein [Chloroflexota bacterium]
MGKTFDDVEKDIDAVLDSLPIFRLPLNVALIDCLSVYERQMLEVSDIRPFSSYDAIIVHIKESIQTLIPKLYKRCSKPTSAKYPPNTARAFNTAQQALEFCSRYSSFEHCFMMHHYDKYQGNIEGNVITFVYPPGMNFGLDQLGRSLHIYKEEQAVRQAWEAKQLPPSVLPETARRRMKEVMQSKTRYLLDSIPSEIYIAHKEIAKAVFPSPTIDMATNIGSYTLEHYYTFWLEFATLMLVQHSFCHARSFQENLSRVASESILSFTIEELAILINQHLGLAPEIVSDMVRDMVLNIDTKRPDVLIQPLLPLPPDTLLIAPSLIHTANWELCLMRNWSQRYPDIYSRIIAQKKGALADEVGRLFGSNRFVVSTCRKLKDEHGGVVGDVDVAVFDTKDGGLALFEVKWVLEADSVRESKVAEDQIVKGIEQVKENKERFESDPQNFLKMVFPQKHIDSSDIKYFRIVVVGNGDTGGHEPQKKGVPVFDYDLMREVTEGLEAAGLEEILTSIKAKQNTFIDEINKRECVIETMAAGYLFRLPGYDTRPGPTASYKKPPRISNSQPCICGSGRKFRDCCKKLEL